MGWVVVVQEGAQDYRSASRMFKDLPSFRNWPLKPQDYEPSENPITPKKPRLSTQHEL